MMGTSISLAVGGNGSRGGLWWDNVRLTQFAKVGAISEGESIYRSARTSSISHIVIF